MSNIESKIYDCIKSRGQYTFSLDDRSRAEELKAIDKLSEAGYIIIKSRTIGYVIADAL